jgi:hypothetical protein
MNRQDTKTQRIFNFSEIRNPLLVRILLLVISVSVLLFFYIVVPADITLVQCAFYKATGYPCLTCGMTRSLHALAHAEIISAFHFHLIGPFLFIAILLFAVKNFLEIVTGERLKIRLSSDFYRKSSLIIGIIWIAYWILRLLKQAL